MASTVQRWRVSARRVREVWHVDGPAAAVAAAGRGLRRRVRVVMRRSTRRAQPTDPSRAGGSAAGLWHRPGHFYSPLTSWSEIEADALRVWPKAPPAELLGIDLRLDAQVDTLQSLAKYHDELPPYGPRPIAGFRFRTENRMYGLADAATLYAFMRHRRPRRIVEVGSGFSSAVILDTVEHFLEDSPLTTLIEPNPDRLHSVLRPGDRERVDIVAKRVQDVGLDLFVALGAGDILVIDSSHVAKTGSDVNHLYFEVLPRLAPGVLVHVHDIGFPFEYPRDWVREGRSWNEAYVLRAFLTFNDRFRIELWNGCLRALRPAAFDTCPRYRGGSQIWISRSDVDA